MHVLVVGGGVIGLSQAYELALQNHRVTVLEARQPGSGASGVNAGWVVPALASPVPAPGVVLQAMRWMLRSDSPLLVRPSLDPGYLRFLFGMWRNGNERAFRAGFEAQVRLASTTIERLDEYRRDGIDFEVHRDGVLLAYRSQQTFDRQRNDLEIPTRFGFEPEVLEGDAVREYEPALTGSVVGGVRFARECHVDPLALVVGLRRRCEALGVRVVTACPVTGLERAGTRALAALAPNDRVVADAFVLAAGAWTRPLAARLGLSVPVHPGKGYAIDVTPAPIRLRSMLYLAEAKVALTPFDGRLRLAGTMELGRLDERIDRVRVAAIGRAPDDYVRGWAVPKRPLTVGAGMRPMTPDGLPVIGRLAPFDNVYVTSGHGMMGVTLAPSSAQALASAIGGGVLPAELRPFDPARFGRRRRLRRTRRPSSAGQRPFAPAG